VAGLSWSARRPCYPARTTPVAKSFVVARRSTARSTDFTAVIAAPFPVNERLPAPAATVPIVVLSMRGFLETYRYHFHRVANSETTHKLLAKLGERTGWWHLSPDAFTYRLLACDAPRTPSDGGPCRAREGWTR